MRRAIQRPQSKALFRPILLTVAASLAVAAAGPKVHAYLAEKSFFGLRPSFEHLTPNGKQIVPIYAGSSNEVLQRIELEKGKSVVLAADYDVERVAVGDPTKVGIVMTDSRTVQVVAKEPGDTNLLLWGAEGKLQTALDLHVGVIHNQLFAELERALGSENVRVDMAGESVIRGPRASRADRHGLLRGSGGVRREGPPRHQPDRRRWKSPGDARGGDRGAESQHRSRAEHRLAGAGPERR
jgi:hypothetical protein